jgi:Holliday junction resolvase RusA-like endonuclease
MSFLEFFVPGRPGTKGSARAFVVGGRAIVRNDNAKEKDWRQRVALAAGEAMAGTPWDGPVVVKATFYLQRPLAHLKTGGALRPSAPRFPTGKPDVDKMVRSLLDALENIVYTRDARVVTAVVTKAYVDPTYNLESRPGVRVTAWQADKTAAQSVSIPGARNG